MGKRKSAKRVSTKKKNVVPKSFKCPFCSHEDSCEVVLDRKNGIGGISCRVCGEGFQSREVTYLSDPVDVYCEWIDACEDAKVAGAAGSGAAGGGSAAAAGERSTASSAGAGRSAAAAADSDNEAGAGHVAPDSDSD